MDPVSDRIITAPIADFCILSGLGRSRVYELLADGTLESVKIGKRRLVIIDSYRRLIEQQRGSTPAQDPAAKPPRRTYRSADDSAAPRAT